jgi:hypothetical protein
MLRSKTLTAAKILVTSTDDEKARSASANLLKEITFHSWPKLPVSVQRHAMLFMQGEDLIALSQVARLYRQLAKEILLKRWYPYDYERLQRSLEFEASLAPVNSRQQSDARDAKSGPRQLR